MHVTPHQCEAADSSAAPSALCTCRLSIGRACTAATRRCSGGGRSWGSSIASGPHEGAGRAARAAAQGGRGRARATNAQASPVHGREVPSTKRRRPHLAARVVRHCAKGRAPKPPVSGRPHQVPPYSSEDGEGRVSVVVDEAASTRHRVACTTWSSETRGLLPSPIYSRVLESGRAVRRRT